MIVTVYLQDFLHCIELASNVTLFVLLVLSIRLSIKIGLKLNRKSRYIINLLLITYISLGILEITFEIIKPLFIVYDLLSFLCMFIVGLRTLREIRRAHPEINPEKHYLKIFLLYIFWFIIVIYTLKLNAFSSVMIAVVGIKYLLIGLSANIVLTIAIRTQYKILSLSLTTSVILYFGVSFASFFPYILPNYFLFFYIVYMIAVYTAHLNLVLSMLAMLSATSNQHKNF